MERASIVKVLRRGQLEAYVRPGRFSRLGVGRPSHHIVHTGLFRRNGSSGGPARIGEPPDLSRRHDVVIMIFVPTRDPWL